MSRDNIKLAHEIFVTGHSGSNPIDILLTVFPVIPGTFSAILLSDCKNNLYNFGVQYVLCILPLIFSFTVFSSFTISINFFMLVVAVASWAHSRKFKLNQHFSETKKSAHFPFLTGCRSTITICTVIAILGVDFHCFPRRFAKTELYGYSLMDIGVSCFVFMNGGFDRIRTQKTRHLMSIVVLIILGFLRLLSVRATSYQHHVTEYGMHANFFFTLAGLKLLCSWWTRTVRPLVGLTICLLLCFFHHLILSSGVADWTLSDAPRDSIISANREFMVSMPGYVVIYVMGGVLAASIFDRLKVPVYQKNKQIVMVSTFLIVLSVPLIEILEMAPSRRLANPAFVLWTIIFVLFFLNMFKLTEILSENISGKLFSPLVFECVNANPLLFFLAANVLTGLINFSVNTMKVALPFDFIIINIYVLSLLLSFYLLYVKSSRIES